MRNFIRILFLIPMFVMVAPAHSATQINDQIPNAKIVGQGRLTYMLWDVYDAALYAPDGAWDEAKPFALRLSYLRHLKGKKIADRSIEEIRKQGFTDEIKLADWHAQMRKIFPDVENGTSLTGVRTQGGEAVFYKNDVEVGRIKDPAFTKSFFNIWLSDKTTEPDLRRKLLGLS